MFLQNSQYSVFDGEITRSKRKELRLVGKITACKPSKLIIVPRTELMAGCGKENHLSTLIG